MSTNPYDRIPFDQLRAKSDDFVGAPPELKAHIYSAFVLTVLELPEAEARALGEKMNQRERDVIARVMQLQGNEYRPLHQVLRKLSPSDLRVWDRVETRLEKHLADREGPAVA